MRGVIRISTWRNEGGFVLVWALLLMVVLVLLGISAIDTSVFESTMTTNDALHKQSFFQADGGANVASMLIEENVSCPDGFKAGNIPILGNVQVNNLTLYANFPPSDPPSELASNRGSLPPIPLVPISDNPTANGPIFAGNGGRDAYYFYNAADPNGNILPRTNIKTYGKTIALAGGGMEMAAGYEGKGKSAAGGGAAIDYDTFSQYIYSQQSQNTVEIIWQHIIGLEGTCNY